MRGGVDHSEFRGYVFALLFYKRINDVYLENVAALEAELGDPPLARDPRMHDFVVPDECVWEKVARKTERELGTALNDAMRPIAVAPFAAAVTAQLPVAADLVGSRQNSLLILPRQGDAGLEVGLQLRHVPFPCVRYRR